MTIAMDIDTDAIRREHREILAPRIDALRRVADSVGTAAVEEVWKGVEEAYAFLVQDLIPHAEWEDAVLYPAVGRALGAPGATATMSRDHEEIRDLAEELENMKDDIRGETLEGLTFSLRRVLYGLYTLVKVHFAKEEGIYLPILDGQPGRRAAEALLLASEPSALEPTGTGP
jgi:iron-sulfur cluster repair protein YtfE (RIC family)